MNRISANQLNNQNSPAQFALFQTHVESGACNPCINDCWCSRHRMVVELVAEKPPYAADLDSECRCVRKRPRTDANENFSLLGLLWRNVLTGLCIYLNIYLFLLLTEKRTGVEQQNKSKVKWFFSFGYGCCGLEDMPCSRRIISCPFYYSGM